MDQSSEFHGAGADTGRRNGDHSSMQDQISEQAQAVAEKAQELGTEALDRVDGWLKPVGLSLKERPVVTLAVLGGVALAIGAIWSSRAQRPSSQAMMDQLGTYARRAGWS